MNLQKGKNFQVKRMPNARLQDKNQCRTKELEQNIESANCNAMLMTVVWLMQNINMMHEVPKMGPGENWIQREKNKPKRVCTVHINVYSIHGTMKYKG